MEVITEYETRRVLETQAERMESYRFRLDLMERKSEKDGCKGIH